MIVSSLLAIGLPACGKDGPRPSRSASGPRDAAPRPAPPVARAPDARALAPAPDAAVAARRPPPPVRYEATDETCNVRDRIRGHMVERVDVLPGQPEARTRLGCGRVAASEPDGWRRAAVVLTRHTCHDMGGAPCGEVIGYFDLHGPSGKVVHRGSAHEAPGLVTLEGRYLLWLECPHGAPACGIQVLDPGRGREVTLGYGTVRAAPVVQGTAFAYVEGLGDDDEAPAGVHCFDARSFGSRLVRRVPASITPDLAWVGPGRLRVQHAGEGDEEGLDEVVSCPPTGDAPVAPDRPDGIVAVKATAMPVAATFRGDPGRTGQAGADETGGRVLAGEVKWRHAGRGFSASAAVHGNTVYVGGFDGALRALDLLTGARRWSYRTGDKVRSTAAVAHGLVLVGSNDRHLHAVDAATGAPRWKHALGGAVFSSPAVTATAVIVGSEGGRVVALDPRTGQPRWTAAAGGPVAASPLVAGGLVVVGVNHPTRGALLALDEATGRERWRRAVEKGIKSTAALAGERVVVGTYAGALLAVTLRDGREAWRTDLGGAIPGTPAVAGAAAVVGTMKGRVAAVALATGAPVWTRELGSGVFSSPAVRLGRVHVGTKDGRLVTLDAGTGSVVWTLSLRAAVDASPVIAPSGLLLVGNIQSAFYAIR